MKLVDVHAHLTDPALAPEMEAVLLRAAAAGVGAILTVGNDEETSRAAAALALGSQMAHAGEPGAASPGTAGPGIAGSTASQAAGNEAIAGRGATGDSAVAEGSAGGADHATAGRGAAGPGAPDTPSQGAPVPASPVSATATAPTAAGPGTVPIHATAGPIQLPVIYAAVGYHPHDAQSASEAGLKNIGELLSRPEVVAMGEIGLDYYYELSLPMVQREVFRRQIRIARRAKKPIIVHSRDAHPDTLKILKEEQAEEVGGVMHCFSGDEEVARAVLDLGFYISFAGNLTFKSAHVLREVAAWLPLERVLVETDCPYLAPEPRRGRRNEPAYVRYTAELLAQIRALPLAELAHATSTNAARLFRLPLASPPGH